MIVTTGKRILSLMHNLGMTQTEFAESIGYSLGTLRQWIGDHERPGRDALVKIADLGDVSVDWLLGREKPEGDFEQLMRDHKHTIDRFLAEQAAAGTIVPVDGEDFVAVPLVGEVSAGPGVLAREEIEEYLPVLREEVPAGSQPFGLRVRGDCLRGWGITEGDIVLVAGGLEAQDGDLVVAVIEDEAYLKRLKRAEDQLLLLSDNPDIQLTAADDARIIGPVLSARRYYRK